MVFKKSFFKIGMWTPRPPPLHGKILNFHFDYWIISLSHLLEGAVKKPPCILTTREQIYISLQCDNLNLPQPIGNSSIFHQPTNQKCLQTRTICKALMMRGRGMFSVLSRIKRWKSALQWASWKRKWKSGGRWALWSFSPQLPRGEKVFITPLFKTDKRKKQKRKNTQVPFFFLRATDFFVKTYISSSLDPSNQSVLSRIQFG